MKLLQRFISHVTTSETETKIISTAERVLNLFQNYLSDTAHVGKYLRAAISI